MLMMNRTLKLKEGIWLVQSPIDSDVIGLDIILDVLATIPSVVGRQQYSLDPTP